MSDTKIATYDVARLKDLSKRLDRLYANRDHDQLRAAGCSRNHAGHWEYWLRETDKPAGGIQLTGPLLLWTSLGRP